jgi:hypothetical protein
VTRQHAFGGENSFVHAIVDGLRPESNRKQRVEQERMQEEALNRQLPPFMELSSRLEGKSKDPDLRQPDKRLLRHDVVQVPG